MREERLTFRVTKDEKAAILFESKKMKMNMSEFINRCIKQAIDLDNLVDSQQQFLQLFDVAFKSVYDQYFNVQKVVLNKIDFTTQWLLKQTDIFMRQLAVPTERENIKTSFYNHPITELAHEVTLKSVRSFKQKKADLEDVKE